VNQAGTGLLRPALQAKSDAAFDVIAGGSILSVSGDGQSVSMEGSSVALFTPQMAVDMWGYLIERFDNSKTSLIQAGNAAPTDAQVEADMEAKMRPVMGYTDNWMYVSK
jgi:hypothetical protein